MCASGSVPRGYGACVCPAGTLLLLGNGSASSTAACILPPPPPATVVVASASGDDVLTTGLAVGLVRGRAAGGHHRLSSTLLMCRERRS